MKKNILLIIGFALMMVFSFKEGRGQSVVCPDPLPGKLVHDFYNKIDDNAEAKLEQALVSYNKRTGIEFTIVTVKDMQGQDNSEYGVGLFEKWGIGEEGVDNGVLLVVSFEDRQWRIVTGYGSEIYLTDIEAASIAEKSLIPHLKAATPTEGIVATAQAIMAKLGTVSWEERLAQKAREEAKRKAATNAFLRGLLLFVFGALIIVGIVMIVIREKKKAAMRKRVRGIDSSIKLSGIFKLIPHWAQKEYEELQKKEKNARSYYANLKKDFKSKIHTQLDEAERIIKELEHAAKRINDTINGIESLPKRITAYEKDAPVEVKNALLVAKALKNEIEARIKDGFSGVSFSSGLKCLDSIIPNMEKWETKLAKPSPDDPKAACDATNDTRKLIKSIKEPLDKLLASRKEIIDGVPAVRNTLKTLDEKHTHAEATLKILKDCFPESIWAPLEVKLTPVKTWTLRTAKESIEQAFKFISSQHESTINRAAEFYNDAMDKSQTVQEIYDSIDKALKEQVEAEKKAHTARNEAEKSISTAKNKCSDSDVESVAKSKLKNATSEFSEAETKMKGQIVNWLAVLAAFETAKRLADEARRKAESDISDAQTARHRQSSHSSTPGYSSSSNHSSGSSFGGFGGGSTGGGGAGGRW